jgi:hypothetical protein
VVGKEAKGHTTFLFPLQASSFVSPKQATKGLPITILLFSIIVGFQKYATSIPILCSNGGGQ